MIPSPPQSTPFPPLPVTAAGMCTSLGGLLAGCAAARAGILRISAIPIPGTPGSPPEEVLAGGQAEERVEESPSPGVGPTGAQTEDGAGKEIPLEASPESSDDVWDEEEALPGGHRARGLPEESRGMERLAHLGAAALADLFSQFPGAVGDLGRLGLVLCLPSGYLPWAHSFTGGAGQDAFSSGVFLDPDEGSRLLAVKKSLLPLLFSLVPDLPEPTWTGLVLEDQAGFAEGVARAAALLSQGRLDSCLLGGIDSRLDPGLMRMMGDLGLLASPDFPAGFIPGEAGAFLLLRAPGPTDNVQGWIDASARMADGSHRFSGNPPVGDSLTESVRVVLGGETPPTDRLLLLGSVNGSPWNSNEWAYLLTRLRAAGEAEHWFPASSFGEMGAAFGPVAACMAFRGFARGYAGADRAVIALSSESGRKGAAVLRRPAPTGETT